MLYTLITKNELDQILKILDQHKIKHHHFVNEDLIENQNEMMKQHTLNHRGEIRRTNAFYNLQIEKEDFNLLPDEAKLRLEKFNIYPDLSDELFHAETEHITPIMALKPPKKFSAFEKILAILGLIFLAYLALNWLDKYIIKVYPHKEDGVFYHERMFKGQLIDWDS